MPFFHHSSLLNRRYKYVILDCFTCWSFSLLLICVIVNTLGVLIQVISDTPPSLFYALSMDY